MYIVPMFFIILLVMLKYLLRYIKLGTPGHLLSCDISSFSSIRRGSKLTCHIDLKFTITKAQRSVSTVERCYGAWPGKG